MTPDERAFRVDLEKASFLLGSADGRWRLLDTAWPYALIAVVASDGVPYPLRFNLVGYPETPPTAGPWNAETNGVLEENAWPPHRGGRLGAVFRADWKGGTALYLPCDRVSLQGHDNWVTLMPSKIWRPSVGIVHYLELVHELLNCSDYQSPSSAAA